MIAEPEIDTAVESAALAELPFGSSAAEKVGHCQMVKVGLGSQSVAAGAVVVGSLWAGSVLDIQ